LKVARTVEYAFILVEISSGKVELADEYQTFHACRLRLKQRERESLGSPVRFSAKKVFCRDLETCASARGLISKVGAGLVGQERFVLML
jgi:hypothetical protein